jgi:hypothetical protein
VANERPALDRLELLALAVTAPVTLTVILGPRASTERARVLALANDVGRVHVIAMARHLLNYPLANLLSDAHPDPVKMGLGLDDHME